MDTTEQYQLKGGNVYEPLSTIFSSVWEREGEIQREERKGAAAAAAAADGAIKRGPHHTTSAAAAGNREAADFITIFCAKRRGLSILSPLL